MTTSRRLAINMIAGIFSNFCRIGIQVLMLPLMARLLGPGELGLAALAFPVFSFVLLLSDAGLGNSLAREKDPDADVWSSAFWGVLGLGVLLAVGVYFASHIVAAAAHQPRLPALMIPLCFAVVLASATVVPTGRMFREGRMSYGSLSDLLANLMGAGVAIWLAFSGAGAWSLAAQSLVLYLVRCVLYNWAFPSAPKLKFNLRSLAGHTSVGGALIGARLMEAAGRLAENAVVSRHLGSAALGAYGYANQIARFFTESVSNAIWSNLYYLSLHREGDTMRSDYLNAQRMLAISILPAAALASLALPMLIPVLFGPQWTESIHPMMALLVSQPFSALGSQIWAVLAVQNRTRFILLSSLALNLARFGVVVACYPMGISAIAWGVAAVNVFGYLLSVYFASIALAIPVRDSLKVVRGPFLSTMVAAGALGFYLLTNPSPGFILLGAALVGAGLLYVSGLLLFDRARTTANLTMIVGMIKKRFA